MNIIGLDGKIYNWNLVGYSNNNQYNKSSYHLEARKLIKEIFPTCLILEEVPVPGSRLFLDFFIPLYHIIIEVHGEQHFEFNTFFHKNKAEFAKSQVRDQEKKNWAELNQFKFIELLYNESIEQWKNKLIK